MTNVETNLQSKNPSPAIFPLGLCMASIAMTSLGLIAAAAGIKWGAAPPPGDALREAWLYVQVMATLGWFVVWPAMSRATAWRAFAHECLVTALGTLPAFAVAAVLSGVSTTALAACVSWQCSCAVFALGVLALATRWRALATILPAIALALPLMAYLSSDFFAVDRWAHAIPPIAGARAARVHSWDAGVSTLFWIFAGYACTGIALLTLAWCGRESTTQKARPA